MPAYHPFASRAPARLVLFFFAIAAAAADLCAQDGPTGAELYKVHCAGCHGINGDGKGQTELKIPARSFQEGRFAFGNTPEQLLKTVTRGIKGRTEMPSFEEKLSEAERKKIVDHVVTLLPKATAVSEGELRLDVTDRPRIVRGIFRGLKDGIEYRPRACLIGYIGGLSLEYRTDDVRLIAVRRGGFVERSDWQDRGGSALKPLGKIVHLFGGGDPGPLFSKIDGDQTVPLASAFAGTWIKKTDAGLEYRVKDADEKVLANVTEWARDEQISAGVGMTRLFTIKVPNAATLKLEALSGSDGAQFLPQTVGAKPTVVNLDGVEFSEWRLLRQDDGPGFTAVIVRTNIPAAIAEGDKGAIALPIAVTAPLDVYVSVTLVSIAEWNEETLGRISKEIRR